MQGLGALPKNGRSPIGSRKMGATAPDLIMSRFFNKVWERSQRLFILERLG
jgi:hypothetical protein